ncbi:MAG: DUF2298 domain-containing protein [Bacillota bacterium]
MLADFFIVFKWWLYILLLGIIFLPLTQKYFGRFIDKGYAFSKVLAAVITGFTLWALSSLKILSFSYTNILLVLAVWAAINLYIAFQNRRPPAAGHRPLAVTEKLKKPNSLRKGGKPKVVPSSRMANAGDSWPEANHWIKFALFEEIIFLLLLIFWSYIRGLQPNIHGLEKFMDFGFINAALRADYMPPTDIWFAGRPINYYYFGHYLTAFLTRFTGIKASITYNLMLGTILANTFALSFSLAANMFYSCSRERLKKAVIAGIIAALMVTFAGNLHGFIYAYAKPFIEKNITYENTDYKYFYSQSTRYIGFNPVTNDKTIHEFPIYSFVVSDLHGHVSDIPHVITFLALLYAYAIGRRDRKGPDTKTLLLGSLLLAVMYMTNAWDYAIYMVVAGAVLFCFELRVVSCELHRRKANENYQLTIIKSKAVEKIAELFSRKKILSFGYCFLVIVILSQLFMLPFNLSFEPMMGGVDFVKSRSQLYQLLILWGHQFFFAGCFIAFIIYKIVRYCRRPNKAKDPDKGFSGLLNNLHISDIFCFTVTLCALGLILLPEIVYVVDIYSKNHHRANTMFKLTYQAFIMLGLMIGYISARLVNKPRKLWSKLLVSVVFALMLGLPMLYPPLAVKGYYGELKASNYDGLDGLEFLRNKYPGDYEAVKWFEENVKGQTVILEANGDSYTDYCRISMATGLPTVQGWYVHEWLWRNSSELPRKRAEEVAVVYESQDTKRTFEIIHKYNIQYIILGRLERLKFQKLNEEKLLSLGTVVFESEQTKIIKIKAY